MSPDPAGGTRAGQTGASGILVPMEGHADSSDKPSEVLPEEAPVAEPAQAAKETALEAEEPAGAAEAPPAPAEAPPALAEESKKAREETLVADTSAETTKEGEDKEKAKEDAEDVTLDEAKPRENNEEAAEAAEQPEVDERMLEQSDAQFSSDLPAVDAAIAPLDSRSPSTAEQLEQYTTLVEDGPKRNSDSDSSEVEAQPVEEAPPAARKKRPSRVKTSQDHDALKERLRHLQALHNSAPLGTRREGRLSRSVGVRRWSALEMEGRPSEDGLDDDQIASSSSTRVRARRESHLEMVGSDQISKTCSVGSRRATLSERVHRGSLAVQHPLPQLNEASWTNPSGAGPELKIQVLFVSTLAEPEYRVGDIAGSWVGMNSQFGNVYVKLDCARQSKSTEPAVNPGGSRYVSFDSEIFTFQYAGETELDLQVCDRRGLQALVRGDPTIGKGKLALDDDAALSGTLTTVEAPVSRQGKVTGIVGLRWCLGKPRNSRVGQPKSPGHLAASSSTSGARHAWGLEASRQEAQASS